mmetsp:Transcript_34759/g.44343  ORF Transcript_34759/g.44343 Transcript_34759/m.44343 type:complete len:81 (-) Transcript_34759:269-511(-)
MADDGYSASQLRQRYNKGGTLNDDQLTAAQLRARHGIQSNRQDFSTGDKTGGSGNMMVIVVVLLVVAAGVGFFLFKSNQS